MTPAELTALNDVVKTQQVRILDVVVIGPLMIWGGLALSGRSKLAGAALTFFGASTIWYNARNYRRTEEAR